MHTHPHRSHTPRTPTGMQIALTRGPAEPTDRRATDRKVALHLGMASLSLAVDQQVRGWVIDVSPGGACLCLAGPKKVPALLPGASACLVLEVGGTQFLAVVEVRNVIAGPASTRVGLAFTGLSDAQGSALADILTHLPGYDELIEISVADVVEQ